MSEIQKMSLSVSQAMMKRAMEYYLRNVLLKADVSVEKVEMTDTSTGVHHFEAHLIFPNTDTP